MSRNTSRTPFFKRNQVRKRRVAIATASVVAGITAATVFLCLRPAVAPAVAASLPITTSAKADQPERQAAHDGAAAVAAVAMASGAMVTLVDRHASDAVRMADASDNASVDDLGWDYVQLRL
ncbi:MULTISPECIES: hypothetical protein [unclassified Cupriavidus]|uniref:hypothetical protein n=1 Tax=unclassified Cupriavidus TaxID=2640874 RepID=UPI00088D723B|nr:hypothetical protein [Cupriavidus sp. YR651]SDC38313.1 hypothetical protein SAMN05216345_10262 [Cupriavidus sp. YR651]